MLTHVNGPDPLVHSRWPVEMTAATLAHQGGWDEILLVMGPIAVIVGLIVVAQRRARTGQDRSDAPDEAVSDR
jgi:uncharacterized membrane protein